MLFVGFGPIVMRAVEAAAALATDGWSIGVINARFAKPLDTGLIFEHARRARLVVTFEESVVTGGFGAGVLEAIEAARLTDPSLRDVRVRILGIPGEAFVDHGSVKDLRRVLRLDAEASPSRSARRWRSSDWRRRPRRGGASGVSRGEDRCATIAA